MGSNVFFIKKSKKRPSWGFYISVRFKSTKVSYEY